MKSNVYRVACAGVIHRIVGGLVLLSIQFGLRVAAYKTVENAVRRIPYGILANVNLPMETIVDRLKQADKTFPGRRTCLDRALSLQALSRAFGHEVTLRIGVRRSGRTIEAHAWIVQGDRILLGGDSSERFTPFQSRRGK